MGFVIAHKIVCVCDFVLIIMLGFVYLVWRIIILNYIKELRKE